jgi:hypothetical protein
MSIVAPIRGRSPPGQLRSGALNGRQLIQRATYSVSDLLRGLVPGLGHLPRPPVLNQTLLANQLGLLFEP